MRPKAEICEPLFAPAGDGYVSAGLVRGPWDAGMMHGGAPSALLARAIEALEPGSDLVVVRLAIEFLSAVPLGAVQVSASLAKPGRRFQVVDAELHAGGRRACLARAVRVRRADLCGAAASGGGAPDSVQDRVKRTTPPADSAPALPPPEAGHPLKPWAVAADNKLFYPAATEIRQVGGELGSGAVAAWIRLRGELVAGEAPSQLARVAAAADFTNGLSWILPIDDWLFVNTDLTIHLHRAPEGEWIGVDARTSLSSGGFGTSTATLHDVRGPIGVAAQSLFVEPR